MENYRELENVYGMLKQLRQKKEYNRTNIKDKRGNLITEEDQIMVRWREYFKELIYMDIQNKLKEEQRRKAHRTGLGKTEVVVPNIYDYTDK